MLPYPFNQFRYILASQSPRRQQLLKGMGFDFEVRVKEIEEVVPPELMGSEIAIYLSEAKAGVFQADEIEDDTILITADTIVWHNGKMLGKPADEEEARQMLRTLSGSWHEVFTGICLSSHRSKHSFSDSTKVLFRPLTDAQIDFYIAHYQPFDKAGSYGVQEWIGYIAVDEIAGSFYNVMGFPTQKLYPELQAFLEKEIQLYRPK